MMPKTDIVEKHMSVPEIRMKAKALGITPGKMRKAELIRATQAAEGYTPCFGRSDSHCPHTDCCFIKDCLKVKP
jgi:hypothetical protein